MITASPTGTPIGPPPTKAPSTDAPTKSLTTSKPVFVVEEPVDAVGTASDATQNDDDDEFSVRNTIVAIVSFCLVALACLAFACWEARTIKMIASWNWETLWPFVVVTQIIVDTVLNSNN